MKKISVTGLILFFAYTGFAQPAKHVVFISVDGFRPDFYMDSSWPTPTIRQLMKNGSYAKGVNSVFPSMTYPAHTTIITGVQPMEHGIYYNDMFEPAGKTGKIYWNYNAIKVPTILGAAQKKGLKVASLFWPVSAEAPVSYNIADIGSMGEGTREEYSKPQGFLKTVKQDLFKDASKIDYGRNVNVARIAAYVIQKDQPDLTIIHFFAVDHAEHAEGREGEMVRSAVADADSGVAIIVDALKAAGIYDNTVVMVGGDHGFKNVTTTVSPNVWLAGAGLLTDTKADWKAQFFTVGGSAYLYVKDNDKEIFQQVRSILNKLPDDEKKYFQVIDRKKLDRIGGNPEVQLALTGIENASFNGAYQGEAVKAGKGGAHGYFPDSKEIQTGLVVCGPGIKIGGVITEMNLRDIAPVMAKLLGLSLPSSKGKIPSGLLTGK